MPDRRSWVTNEWRRAWRERQTPEARLTLARRAENGDDRESPYTCESCRGQDFRLIVSVDRQQEVRETLQCSCGAKRECAATRTLLITAQITTDQLLGPDHRAHADDEGEREVEEEQEEVALEVVCRPCYPEAQAGD